MSARHHLLVQGVALLAACTGDDGTCVPTSNVALASSDGWAIASADEDPFTDRPVEAQIRCIPQTVSVEGPAVEIDTAACNYVTLVQATRADASACDVLRATLAHSPLFFEEPATAHVALRVKDEVVFDRTIEIPAAAGIYEIVHDVERSFIVGTPIYFHVHNHGANNWFVTDVRLDP